MRYCLCFVSLGFQETLGLASGGAGKHPGPFWPLTVKTPPSGGILTVGAPAGAGILSGPAGPDKMPAPVGVLS